MPDWWAKLAMPPVALMVSLSNHEGVPRCTSPMHPRPLALLPQTPYTAPKSATFPVPVRYSLVRRLVCAQ